jgi:hypothetical protein
MSTAADNKVFQQLGRGIMLLQQVLEARYYIMKAEEIGHPEQFQSLNGIFDFLALFRNALNSYAKCFVESGPGKTTLKGDSVFANDANRLANHEKIMLLRNKFLAHCDENEMEKSKLEFTETDSEILVSFDYHFSFPFDRLYELRDLIRSLEEHLVDRQQKQIENIERTTGKTLRIKQKS